MATRASQENVTVENMHELLQILRDGLSSRDKALEHIQTQVHQNQLILARRATVYKIVFALLALSVIAVGWDQHSIIKSFDTDMTNVSLDMDKMVVEMREMKTSMKSMSVDIHTMSKSFESVATDVHTISDDVTKIRHGVIGMSRDTNQMNRQMNQMTPW